VNDPRIHTKLHETGLVFLTVISGSFGDSYFPLKRFVLQIRALVTGLKQDLGSAAQSAGCVRCKYPIDRGVCRVHGLLNKKRA
jgi:hypothetical protein